MRIKVLAALMVLFLILALAPGYAAPDNPAKLVQVSLPEKNWGVVIRDNGFKISESEYVPSFNARRIEAVNERTRMVLSILIEPAAQTGDSKVCRAHYQDALQASPAKNDEQQYREIGAMALCEGTIKKIKNTPVDYKTVNAYLVQDGCWIDVHLSKTNSRPEDKKLFDEMVASIKIASPYAPCSLDTLDFGNAWFHQTSYAKAIACYEQALALEKKSPALPKNQWRVLVDSLGMAYGISGDLAKAKTTLEYGVSKDPAYPNFYYNLACAHAEANDLDDTMAMLRKAFQYKANRISGERMPDPRSDDSFKKFMKDEKFVRFLDKIMK